VTTGKSIVGGEWRIDFRLVTLDTVWRRMHRESFDISGEVSMPDGNPFSGPPDSVVQRQNQTAMLIACISGLVLIVCGGGFAVILAVIFSASLRATVKRAEERSTPPSKSVSAAKLHQDFSANAVAAEDSYRDKFEVVGTVKRVDVSRDGLAVVVLDAGKREEVWCYFLEDTKFQTADLKAGESVSITGRRAKSIVSVVSMSDCRL